ESVVHLFFPQVCSGCGTDILSKDASLCMRCMEAMPETKFEQHADNPVEKMYWGRLPLVSGSAQFYFTKESLMQFLVHQFKYKNNKALGLQLGKIMGRQLQESGRFPIDALVPLPLFPAKEKRRGYNQATVLCNGMAEYLQVPVIKDAIIRHTHTDTQTKKGRIERWQNIEGKFALKNAGQLQNKHILLVDDIITTGATLEACGMTLRKVPNLQLSVATLCIASH
ncbi:MAG: ComF family protein, partial [Chitinophagaceae bacterium]